MTPETYYKDHSIFIESVRKCTKQHIAPFLDSWEKNQHFPNDVFQILGKEGFLGILIPEEFGGVGGDFVMAGAWCEAFGELCAVGLTTAVNMHSLVISLALSRYGNTEAKRQWLPKAVKGEAIGAYAFTEPSVGSDLARLQTKAERKGNTWLLNGAKTFITNGARADFILVLARTDPQAGYKGFTTFVVDTKLPGFKVQKKLSKLGWHSSDTAELTFENVPLSDDCVLGNVGEGWIQASNSLNWERLMLTLTSLAGARMVFKDAVQYAHARPAFGKKIVELEPITDMLSEMQNKIISGTSLCHHALELLTNDQPCRTEVSYAKRKVCEDAVWIADRAIQIHGGYGYTTEFSPERWWRDLRLMPIGGGTSEIMAEIITKDLKI
jgi:acyl-CoA dehydrogenase